MEMYVSRAMENKLDNPRSKPSKPSQVSPTIQDQWSFLSENELILCFYLNDLSCREKILKWARVVWPRIRLRMVGHCGKLVIVINEKHHLIDLPLLWYELTVSTGYLVLSTTISCWKIEVNSLKGGERIESASEY